MKKKTENKLREGYVFILVVAEWGGGRTMPVPSPIGHMSVKTLIDDMVKIHKFVPCTQSVSYSESS